MRILTVFLVFMIITGSQCNLVFAESATSTSGGAQTVAQQRPLPKADINKIISTAKKYQGVPYLFGGSTPKGFDCSGYVQYVFAQNKVKLPRTADEQYKNGQIVCDKSFDYRKLQPGDLLFFATETKAKPVANVKVKANVTTSADDVSHVGIYLGDKKFIDAETKKGITISGTEDAYWHSKFVGARRVVNAAEQSKSLWEYIVALFE
ncbi:MAG: C40 family peptidase [Negativicutes bacterium]|jgi:cell wall-associated NlpC family hydrolase